MNTKTVTVDERQYQVRKLLPDVGSYIYMRMLGALMNAPRSAQEVPEPEPDAPKPTNEEKARAICALAAMRGLSFEDTQFIHRNTLMNASRVDGEVVIPVMNTDGRWADLELRDNPAAAQELVTESLVFSLASFC